VKGRSLDLFSGIAGISAAVAPWFETVGYCDTEPYAQVSLLSRVRTGEVEAAPIYPDVSLLNAEVLRASLPLDAIVGGFPCQDLSLAGKGAGLEGVRSGLFFQISRLAEELEPTFLFLENVPAIRTRGLDQVVRELDRIGYDCRWCVVSAYDVGAPHLRERWFCWARLRGNRHRNLEALNSLCENWDAAAPILRKRAQGWNEGPSTYSDDADPMSGRGDLKRLGVNWPAWGTFSKGVLTNIEPWARRDSGDDIGMFLPTPVTVDGGSYFNRSTSEGAALRPTLGAMAKYNLWPTPKARDWRSGKMSDETFEKRSQGLEAVATRVGNLPTPKAGSNRNSRKAIMGGHPNHPSKSDLSLEQAVECLEGTLPREVKDPAELPSRYRNLFPTPISSTGGGFNGNGTMKLSTAAKVLPTPTVCGNNNHKGAGPKSGDGLATAVKRILPTPVASERSGINPNTGRGAGLSHAIKSEVGILPTPRAGKTTDEDPAVWQKRKDAGKVSTPPLEMAVKLLPTPQSTDDKTGLTPEQMAERQRRAQEKGTTVQRMLRDEVKLMPTPLASEADKCASASLSRAVNTDLPWSFRSRDIPDGPHPQMSLPTPRGGDEGVGLCGGTGALEILEKLEEQGDITEEELSSMANGAGGHLNSEFVEWMMGYRLGYTVVLPEYEALLTDDAARLAACADAVHLIADLQPTPEPTGEAWAEWIESADDAGIWWAEWPGVTRLTKDQPYRRQRLKALGNSVVPRQVRLAIMCLSGLLIPEPPAEQLEQMAFGDFLEGQP
jgi:site-specific DNA-cytosine methylase